MTVNVGNAVGQARDPRNFGVAKDIIDSETYVGVEVELEGIERTASKCPLITTTNDYSLRGDNSVELLFAFPLRGGDVEEGLRAMESYVTTAKVRPIVSCRTSTHVHIDVRDLSVLQLRKFIAVYLSVERLLFHYCGREREESIFCVPTYKSTLVLESISKLLSCTTNSAFSQYISHNFNDNRRYAAMNLNAITKHGTLEFRMLRGTWHYDKLVEWVNILLSIKKYAINAKTKDIMIPSHVYSNNCLGYAKKVFGKLVDAVLYEGFERDIVKGARTSQDILTPQNINENSWSILHLAKESNVLSTAPPSREPVADTVDVIDNHPSFPIAPTWTLASAAASAALPPTAVQPHPFVQHVIIDDLDEDDEDDEF